MFTDTRSKSEKFSVQVRQRGQFTIPQKVRDALAIEDGDIVTLVQIGDVIVLSPKVLRGQELGDKFVALMEEEGVTLADLLEDLPKIREEIYREKYKSQNS